jgi:beta-hydroxylase
LRAHFVIIQKELQSASEYAVSKRQDCAFFKNLTTDDNQWKQFILKWYAKKTSDTLALKMCPETCKILDEMPEVRLAMISILEPGAILFPHHGPFRGILRYHLCISCDDESKKCLLVVNPDTAHELLYNWKTKHDMLFDDTYTHTVGNGTNTKRIVLFMDIDRPLKNVYLRGLLDLCCTYLGPLTTQINKQREKSHLSPCLIH